MYNFLDTLRKGSRHWKRRSVGGSGTTASFSATLHRAMDVSERDTGDTLRVIAEFGRLYREFTARLSYATACARVLTRATDSTSATPTEHATALAVSSLRHLQDLRRDFEDLPSSEEISDSVRSVLRTMERAENMMSLVRNKMPVALDEPQKEPALDACAICLEGCRGRLIRLPCAHTFHRACALDWVCDKKTCPLCRAQVSHLLDCKFPETRTMP
jgi:Ring finger domain